MLPGGIPCIIDRVSVCRSGLISNPVTGTPSVSEAIPRTERGPATVR